MIPELCAEQVEVGSTFGKGRQVWGTVWGNSGNSGSDMLGWRCRAQAWCCPTTVHLTCLVPATPTPCLLAGGPGSLHVPLWGFPGAGPVSCGAVARLEAPPCVQSLPPHPQRLPWCPNTAGQNL